MDVLYYNYTRKMTNNCKFFNFSVIFLWFCVHCGKFRNNTFRKPIFVCFMMRNVNLPDFDIGGKI